MAKNQKGDPSILNFILLLLVIGALGWSFFASFNGNHYGQDILWLSWLLYLLQGVILGKIWYPVRSYGTSKPKILEEDQGKGTRIFSFLAFLLFVFIAYYISAWSPKTPYIYASLPFSILIVLAFDKVVWNFKNMNF